MEDLIKLKKCKCCGVEKPLNEFPKKGIDTYRTSCKICFNEKKRIGRAENREIKKEYQRKYVQEVLKAGKKKCTCCSKLLPLDKFHKNADRKDGYRSTCYSCDTIVKKKQKKKCTVCHEEKYLFDYHLKRSECKSCRKKEYEKNREGILEHKKEYRQENLFKVKQQQKDYYKRLKN